MTLRDADGGGALLSYEADANVTGALAGVGQRLVAAAARRTTREFLEALDREIVAPAPSRAEAAPTTRERAPRARTRGDAVTIAVSALAGAAIALAGVAVGRWSGRR
jgi:hypothetical protein